MARWSVWLKSAVHCAPRPERLPQELGGSGPHQRALRRHDVAVLHQAGFVDGEVGDELHPVGVVVVHRQRERTQRDLTRPRGLVAADHVVHVVAHVMGWRVDVGPGKGDPVAPVEVDVRVTERALRQIVQGFEPLRQLEVGVVDPEVLVAE